MYLNPQFLCPVSFSNGQTDQAGDRYALAEMLSWEACLGWRTDLWRLGARERNHSEGTTPWKINGWNLQPSPMKRKENDLKTNLQGIMVHVNFCRVYPLFRLSRGFAIGVLGLFPQNFWKTPETTSSHLFCIVFFLLFGAFLDGHSGHRKFG